MVPEIDGAVFMDEWKDALWDRFHTGAPLRLRQTVAKWTRRTAVKDIPTGRKDAHSTVLSIEEEAIIVAFRKHTLLPLDDCLYALQATSRT